MKVLVVSDVPDKKYWDYYKEGDLDEFELIISCGDLPPQYLSFLVTLSKCPVFYVHGNHDDVYKDNPPLGCECIDGKIKEYNGIRFLGFGGSLRYKPGINQYSESQMKRRVKHLHHSLRKHKGFDVLVTHAPARELGDGEDHVHRGFWCFRKLLDDYSPKYYFFGHQHLNYGRGLKRQFEYNDTILINATGSVTVELDI